MSDLPLVSVIVPVYNGERFLRQTIDSVLNQTYPNVELIAVDDGSTDGTAQILAGYGDRLRWVRQDNAGVRAARNAGIARSRGEWIAFLDHDDLWDPNKLEVVMAAVHEGDALVYSNVRLINEQGTVTRPDTPEIRRPPVLINFLNDSFTLAPLVVVVRREALERVGLFDTTNRLGNEDMQLWLRLTATGHRFVYVDQVLASYRWHGNNTTLKIGYMMRGRALVLEDARRRYPAAFGRPEWRVYHEQLTSLYLGLGWHAFDRGDYGTAAHDFVRAAWHQPWAPKTWLYVAASCLPFRSRLVPVLRRFVAASIGSVRVPKDRSLSGE